MQQRRFHFFSKIQGASPMPFPGGAGDIFQNSKIRSRTYAKMATGISIPRTAQLARCGFDPSEMEPGKYWAIWPSASGLSSYKLCTNDNGATAADVSIARRLYGHCAFYEVVTPDPNTLSGSARADWEAHVYPYGYKDQNENLNLGVAGHDALWTVDTDTRSSWPDPHSVSYPPAGGLGAVGSSEGSHTFTVVNNTNALLEFNETFQVDWLNSLGGVVASFTVQWHITFDTNDSSFYGVNRMVTGRAYSNTRLASDYFAVLVDLYENHSIDNLSGAVPPVDRMGGLFPVTWLDGTIYPNGGGGYTTTIFSPPQRTSSLYSSADGGYGIDCPPAQGTYFNAVFDAWQLVGFDAHIPKGTYTVTESTFDFGGNLIAGPSGSSYSNNTSWWFPYHYEADTAHLKRWVITNASGAADWLRSQGWAYRPLPSGEPNPVEMLDASGL